MPPNDLEQLRRKVWTNSVVPFVFTKRAAWIERVLFWLGDNVMVVILTGLLFMSLVSFFVWQGTGTQPSFSATPDSVAIQKAVTSESAAMQNNHGPILVIE